MEEEGEPSTAEEVDASEAADARGGGGGICAGCCREEAGDSGAMLDERGSGAGETERGLADAGEGAGEAARPEAAGVGVEAACGSGSGGEE